MPELRTQVRAGLRTFRLTAVADGIARAYGLSLDTRPTGLWHIYPKGGV